MYTRSYMQMGEDFISLVNRVSQESDQPVMVLSTAFSQRTPDFALNDIRRRDINIIFGFFGPETAQYILCRVSY